MKNDERIQYAIVGTASVLAALPSPIFKKVSVVYLFGSVAQRTATDESDVDVFFDCDVTIAVEKSLRKTIQKLYDEFRISVQGLRFKSGGVSNVFSPVVGRIKKWEDIARSIAVSGIQLYGTARLSVRGEPWFVYAWESVKKNRGAFLNGVYGYTIKKKRYSGFLERSGGIKIGKSAAALPRSARASFEELLEKYGVSYVVHVFARMK